MRGLHLMGSHVKVGTEQINDILQSIGPLTQVIPKNFLRQMMMHDFSISILFVLLNMLNVIALQTHEYFLLRKT